MCWSLHVILRLGACVACCIVVNGSFLGSFGHLSSAVVCAASSFGMSIVDPRPFLQEIDDEFFGQYRGDKPKTVSKIRYSEPTITMSAPGKQEASVNTPVKPEAFVSPSIPSPQLPIVKSRIARLGEFINTDAVSLAHPRVFTTM